MAKNTARAPKETEVTNETPAADAASPTTDAATPAETSAPAETAPPAGKAKAVPKMEQILSEDGDTLTFRFDGGQDPALADVVTKYSEYPQNVQQGFGYFGMRTKLRNFTVPKAGEAEASTADMRSQLLTGIALLKAGSWRVAREAGEKGATSTLILEAALAYKHRKAAIQAKDEKARWIVEDAEAEGGKREGTLIDVSKELEALKPEQVEQLKGTALFQLALQDAKDARAAAKRKALEAKVAAEAEASPI
jgi:hypothetical protein